MRQVLLVGQVQFDSVRSFSVTSSAGTNATDNFTGGGTTADASTFLNVGAVDLATVANAEKAIAIIDGALSLADLSRAEQGAISNRLDNTISNLTNVVQILSHQGVVSMTLTLLRVK